LPPFCTTCLDSKKEVLILDNYLDNCHKKVDANDEWKVYYSNLALRQIKELPSKIKLTTFVLVRELKMYGPYRFNWKNYGRPRGKTDCFHCHINKGKPRYVVCWELLDKKVRVLEVYYVGTHEKAPY